jgi:YidC/Oxa1 family membrane protein insertase
MLLYVLPLVFAFGGIAFPIGVLCYWTTSNLWTMGQQFYVIRNNPAPGTPAFRAKQQRDAAKGKISTSGAEAGEEGAAAAAGDSADETAAQAPRRQQPKKQSRSQRKKQGPPTAGGRQLREQGGTGTGTTAAAEEEDEGPEETRSSA